MKPSAVVITEWPDPIVWTGSCTSLVVSICLCISLADVHEEHCTKKTKLCKYSDFTTNKGLDLQM